MERGTIKLPQEQYEKHNERRKSLGQTWSEYIDGQSPALKEPINEFENGVVFLPDERHEGRIKLYENWVRVADPIPAWFPRDRVQEVHEQ